MKHFEKIASELAQYRVTYKRHNGLLRTVLVDGENKAVAAEAVCDERGIERTQVVYICINPQKCSLCA